MTLPKPLLIIRILLYVLLSAGCTSFALAQQQSPAQPIELPEFIVTGKEQIGIPGAAKLPPRRPAALSKTRLDSLNPIEKLPLPPLEEIPLPVYSNHVAYVPGYVSVGIGNYVTPDIEAGYSFRAGEYLVDMKGGYESSGGWVDHSDYSLWNAQVQTTYEAPDRFIVFGRSTTTARASIGSKNFSLFASPLHNSRSVVNYRLGVETVGRTGKYDFTASASWTGSEVETQLRPRISDGGLFGTIRFISGDDDILAGGMIEASLATNGSGYPLVSLGPIFKYQHGPVEVLGTVGAQLGRGTTSETRAAALVNGTVSWQASPVVTVGGGLRSGLRHTTITDLAAENPYLSPDQMVDLPFDVVAVHGSFLYHPLTTFSVGVEGGFAKSNRDVVWVRSADTAMFLVDWQTLARTYLQGNTVWKPSPTDVLSADVTLNWTMLANANTAPYTVPAKVSLSYFRTWNLGLRAGIQVVYCAGRYADTANVTHLSGYTDVRISADYNVGSNLTAVIRAQNLLGSTIFLWEGYKERTAFVRVGVDWRF